MDIQIFDRGINFIGVVDNFNSFRFVDRYSKVGEFEIKAPLTKDMIDLLKQNRIISYKGKAGYIETVQLDVVDGDEIMTIRGKDIKSYLSSRINWNTINYTGTTEQFVHKLVNDNCITTDTSRVIPQLELGNLQGYKEKISKQDSYSNLLDIISEVLTAQELGFKISLNAKDKKLIFDVYKGADRTVNNGNIAPCIFSRSFENVLSQSYIDSLNDYKNTALICGEGEGKERVKTTIGDSNTGLDRQEIYVNASGVTSKVNDKAISQADYIKLLQQNGTEKLSEHKKINTFDSVINTVVATGYNLGDKVTIQDKKWGLLVNARITEIETIYENSGTTVNVTFGNNIPTLIDKIKQYRKD